MLIRQFKKAENEEYGMEGWRMVGAPSTYFPLLGLGVAHDIMEHRQNDEGTVRDELLAFGAALYIRGEGGYWARTGSRFSPGEQIGGEIGSDLAVKYQGISDGIPDPGRTTRLESQVEEWIHDAIRDASKEVNEYLTSFKGEKPFALKQVEAFLTRCSGWLRKGYRASQRRYHGVDVCTLAHVFSEIENKADRLLHDDMSQYCPMVVRLDMKRGNSMVMLDESAIRDDWN